jgi:PPOX class probable F420-dependent enzyme
MGMSDSTGLATFGGHKYLSLETFRKTGEAVRTPVWFAAEPAAEPGGGTAKLYIYTIGNTGKVKRIRNNGRVRIAPCDMRGKLLGEWMDARAEIVTGDEAAHGMRLLNKKYVPWKQLLGFFAMLRPRPRVVMVIHFA